MITASALILLFATFAHITWRDLRLALVVLMGLLPTYLIRFSIGPIPSTALEIFILIALAVWAIKHHALKIDPRSLMPWLRPMLLLLAAACFAVVVALDQFSALGIWKAYFIEPILVFVMLRATFKDERDWRQAFTALAISGIVVSVFAIVQRMTGLGIPAPWDIELRATSLFDYPNAVGLFLAPLISASVMIILHPERSEGSLQKILRRFTPQDGILIGLVILGFVAILLSQTEAALVAIPVALLLTLLDSNASRKTKLIALVSSVLVLGALFVASDTVRAKLTLQDYSGQVRLSQWQETWSLMTSSWRPFVLGNGLNGYPSALLPFHDPTFYEIFQYPHNIILNIWTELGLIGIAAFVWLAVLVVRNTKGGSQTRPYGLAAFAALSTMAIHGLVDVPYFKNDLAILTWFFVAMIAAAAVSPKISGQR